MSYDLYCYKPKSKKPDEKEADSVLVVDGDKWAKKERNPAIKLAIVKALTEYNSRLRAFDFHYGDISNLTVPIIKENANKFDPIEMNHEEGDVALQIMVYDKHVALTVPYWYQDDEAERLFS